MSQPDNTTPAASGQDSHLGELTTAAAIALLLAHGDDALILEHRAAELASRPVRVAARDLSRWVTREWVLRFGSLDARPDPVAWSGFAPVVVQQLRSVRPDPAPVVAAYADRALTLGGRQGATTLAVPAVPVVPDPVTERMAAATTDTVARRYDTAEQLLTSTPVETRDDVTVALAPTHAAVADVDRDARTVVNTAINRGAQQVAETNGADLMWESLRDACVVCLALSGTVVGHTDDFPIDATFGKHSTPWWTPDGTTQLLPPRHPRCRCRCVPYYGHAGPPGSLTLPEALKREAQRSILKGWSLPSESEQVRVGAAERLLARGSNLPKTVQQVARDAVNRGRFTSRDVPQPSGR